MKKKLFSIFGGVLYLVISTHFPVYASVDQAFPKPYVKCEDISNEDNWLINNPEDDEWHSLRPYQASPCKIPKNDEINKQALLCGTDLVVEDRFGPTIGDVLASSCKRDAEAALAGLGPGGTKKCNFSVPRKFYIETDAYNSELPIAGQTELVKGSDPSLLLNALKTISTFPFAPNMISTYRLKAQNKKAEGFDQHVPPNLEDYPNPQDYYIKYQEWRGNFCLHTPTHINIPLVKISVTLPAIMICGDSPLQANFWSTLYPKIPYSSTEDAVGKYSVSKMIWIPSQNDFCQASQYDPNESDCDMRTVEPLVTGWVPKNAADPRNKTTAINESVLFFPHMEETLEESSLLQSTYLPKELLEQEQKIGNDIVTEPPDDKCTLLTVRTNPGDQLFGERDQGVEGGTLGRPAANVSYVAKFTCMVKFNPGSPTAPITFPPGGPPNFNCTEWAWFYSDVSTNTPLIDEIWNKTVAGEASVVRRFFPRSGEDPLKEIQDLPTKTDIVYKVDSKTGNMWSTGGIGKATLMTQNPTLYFPHLGGIHKYFLNGIQSLIRPKDFPANPAALAENTLIPETTQANEYLSWFLNGTIQRAEQDPLNVSQDCIGETSHKAGYCERLGIPLLEKTDGRSTCTGYLMSCWVPTGDSKEVTMLDQNRVTTLSGPLNKLLSQHLQWQNIFNKAPNSKITKEVSRVAQTTPRAGAKDDRHNQVVGCTILSIHIPIINKDILGFPVMCETASQENLPSPAASSAPGICARTDVPNMTSNPACKLSHDKIGNTEIPPLMKKVFEDAGAKNGVPPDLIAGIMYAEGGFEPRVVDPGCYGPYTDESIENAILCEFPNCNADELGPGVCNYDTTQGPGSCINGGTHFGPYQQCPNNYNPCNFFDSTQAAAAKLARDKNGLANMQEYKESGDGSLSCVGINYNLGGASGAGSCQKSGWTCSDVITAIRFETGSCLPEHFCQVLEVYGACNGGCP